MDDLIEVIRTAVAEGATPEQKVAGAHACKTLGTALEAEVGKPIALAGAPAPSPLAGITPDQALDLLIAKLTAMAAERQSAVEPPATKSERAPLRISFVQPPPRALASRKR